MVLALLFTVILSLQSAPGAAFEVDLWPCEGRPVFEAVARRLRLHELPSESSKVVETLMVRPKQRLMFDGTRYRTMKVGQFRVLAPTAVTGRRLGGISRLSKSDYYSGKFGPARVDVAPGDTIEYLQYRAEGTCFVRIAGSVIDADPCPTQKKAEFTLVAEPATEWWIQITVAGKSAGWLLITGSTAKVIDRKG
jgi:plastocyanin